VTAVPALVAGLLRDGTGVRLGVTGHSMAPFVRTGDVLTIEPLRGRRLSRGDVVLSAPDRRLVAHRIVGWRGGRLRLRGDVAPAEDAALAPADVLGVVTRVERGGRKVRLGPRSVRAAIAWLSRSGLLHALARTRERLRGHGSSRSPHMDLPRPPTADPSSAS